MSKKSAYQKALAKLMPAPTKATIPDRWFAEVWSSDKPYSTSLLSPCYDGRPVHQLGGYGRKMEAVTAMRAGKVPEGMYCIVRGDGQVFPSFAAYDADLRQSPHVPGDTKQPGLSYDVLLTGDGLDHFLMTGTSEEGRQLRQLCINIKNRVLEQSKRLLRAMTRDNKRSHQILASTRHSELGRNPVKENCQSALFLFDALPYQLRNAAEEATGIYPAVHTDLLKPEHAGLEAMSLMRQFCFGEEASVASSIVVSQAINHPNYRMQQGKSGRVSVEPEFVTEKEVMTSGKAKKLAKANVVDLVAPYDQKTGKGNPEQFSLL